MAYDFCIALFLRLVILLLVQRFAEELTNVAQFLRADLHIIQTQHPTNVCDVFSSFPDGFADKFEGVHWWFWVRLVEEPAFLRGKQNEC